VTGLRRLGAVKRDLERPIESGFAVRLVVIVTLVGHMALSNVGLSSQTAIESMWPQLSHFM
jgi:hypothetical protein